MQEVSTTGAPAAIGPYSQAIRSGNLLFVSGQIAIDAQTGSLVGGGIVAETRQVLHNLDAVLCAGGSGLDRVVKTTVYLADMADFQAMNDEYGLHFRTPAPARATIQAAALPRGARVEIDAIATVD